MAKKENRMTIMKLVVGVLAAFVAFFTFKKVQAKPTPKKTNRNKAKKSSKGKVSKKKK